MLCLNLVEDQILARQRRKIGDERVRPHDFLQIDLDRPWRFGRAFLNLHHLSSLHLSDLIGVIVQHETRASLQHSQVALALDCRSKNQRRSGNPNRHRSRSELGAARILWHTQENCAAAQRSAPASLVEAENRVRAEARDSQILEGKFRARLVPGTHRRVFAHFVVYHRRSSRRLKRQDFDVLNDLRDPRFLFRLGRLRLASRADGCDDHAKDENLANEIHLIWAA